MKVKSVDETRREMIREGKNWIIPLMDFVDEMRRSRNPDLIRTPFPCDNERMDSILASTVESLCHELGMEVPDWVWNVPGCKHPWFVSEVENLKAISIAESPAFFRRRKIFVLENFLSRV